jgi:hypothetical protein
VELEVATYLRAPTQTIQITLLGPRGEQLGACRIPPSGYHDNAIVECPIGRPEQLRRMVVSASGTAPLAVYAAKEGNRLVVGALVRRRHLGSLGARVRFLGDQLGVLRPALLSPAVLFVQLLLSTALLGAALFAASALTKRPVVFADEPSALPDDPAAPSHDSDERS